MIHVTYDSERERWNIIRTDEPEDETWSLGWFSMVENDIEGNYYKGHYDTREIMFHNEDELLYVIRRNGWRGLVIFDCVPLPDFTEC